MALDKNFRDELAMSLSDKFVPTLETDEAIKLMVEHLGINEPKGHIEYVNFAFEYQAAMRYKYADAMLEARKRKRSGNE
jgi:hypothetical protein